MNILNRLICSGVAGEIASFLFQMCIKINLYSKNNKSRVSYIQLFYSVTVHLRGTVVIVAALGFRDHQCNLEVFKTKRVYTALVVHPFDDNNFLTHTTKIHKQNRFQVLDEQLMLQKQL